MSTTDRLVELNTRHQVQLERYANGEVIAIVQALRNAINAMEDKIRTAPGSTVGMEAYLRELRTLANEILSPVKQSILDRVEPLAVVETNYNIAALTSVTVGAEFAKPSIAAIQRAALSNVLNGKRTRDFLEEVFGLASDQIIYTMRNGIINGFTPAQMLRELVGTKRQNYRDSALRNVYRNTEAVVRTIFNAVGNEAKAATYAANSDVVTGYRIVATLDSKTSDICIALDGKEFELGKGPLPPFHPRCFPGDTLISTSPGITRIYRRRYKGVFIEITTKTGRSIRVTPNHPILTRTGWKAAKLLDSTDQVVKVNFGMACYDQKKNGVIASFSELFSAAEVAVDPSGIADRPTSAEHFHGDVTDTEVRVIEMDRLGRDKVFSEYGLKLVEDKRFILREWVHGALHRFGSGDLFSNRNYSSPGRGVGVFSQFGNFLRGRAFHTPFLLLRSVSQFAVPSFKQSFDRLLATFESQVPRDPTSTYPRFIRFINSGLVRFTKVDVPNTFDRNASGHEGPFHWLVTNAEDLPDLFNGELFNDAHFDDVVDVRVTKEMLTHVYNLENEVNWYVANDIIAHNCRTTTVPIIDPKYRIPGIEGERASRGADGPEPVGAKLTYPTWLRRQPAAFQDDVLGPTRARAFRAGELELRNLIDLKTLKPLTLDELGLKTVE